MNGFGTFEVALLGLLAIPAVLVVWSMWATGAFRKVPH
ncbi:ABC-type glucose/galactose transport system permease subunit [Aeromicrobium panaciterrae]|uniref:ABC-type glucose/galactose transport system permease subunit n=1 Tax=Aeromicrobium panaciterrae TaxID=363861 RepID=A0ABU1UKD6_9ACTN|nr:ABC-type glucose/galactose transport system permease subunit [Aeromicrobium panaciterrae]